MAIEWKIRNTEYNNNSDKGIIHVSWRCTNSEVVSGVTHSGEVLGGESYTPDPSDSNYIAYESVTEANVIDWVKTTLGTDEVTRIENKVDSQITKSKLPPTKLGCPWITE